MSFSDVGISLGKKGIFQLLEDEVLVRVKDLWLSVQPVLRIAVSVSLVMVFGMLLMTGGIVLAFYVSSFTSASF